MKGLFQCPPWARSFCPFRRAAYMGCLTFWALLLWAAWSFGRVAVGLLGLQVVLLWTFGASPVLETC